MRREFSELNKRLGKALEGKTDAAAYFAVVVGEDMEHFFLDAVLPIEAVPVAEGLPRAVEATHGRILMQDGVVFDARYSAACGGRSAHLLDVFPEAAPFRYRSIDS